MILPHLPGPYKEALHQAVRFCLTRFSPVGIIASGTIIRGNPDPASDLDIYVIHLEPFRQRLQRFFHNVPAEIFVNPPAQIHDYFQEEHRTGRPSTAHMLATGVTILANDPVVAQLQLEAREWLAKTPDFHAFTVDMARYGAALLFEDAMDIWEKDPAGAQYILAKAVLAMTTYRFQAANRFLPRDKELLAHLFELDPEAGRMAHAFWSATQPDEKMKIAGRMADYLLGTRGFYEWESPIEKLGHPADNRL